MVDTDARPCMHRHWSLLVRHQIRCPWFRYAVFCPGTAQEYNMKDRPDTTQRSNAKGWRKTLLKTKHITDFF